MLQPSTSTDMRYRYAFLLIFTMALNSIFFAACSKDDDDDDLGEPGTNEVWMQNMQFRPRQKTISQGTTITWINQNGITHTVTDDGGLFNQSVPAGGSFSFTYNTTGTFPYNCTIHPGMDGTIIVQ